MRHSLINWYDQFIMGGFKCRFIGLGLLLQVVTLTKKTALNGVFAHARAQSTEIFAASYVGTLPRPVARLYIGSLKNTH